MPRALNLVSDSSLVQETLDLARKFGNRVACMQVAESVFKINNASEALATSLVSELIQNDPRLEIEGSQLLLRDSNVEERALRDIDFVIVDVEAIGGRSVPARIIEIGACHVIGDRITRQFETLVNPEVPLQRFVSNLTGITDEMLAAAPKFANIAERWLEFIGDSVLVAHNADFDVGLLNREIARMFPGFKMGNAELCTFQLSRRVAPFLVNHNLDALADHCGFEIAQRHRALPDALATARIFLRFLDELEVHGVRTLAQARVVRLPNDRAKINSEQLVLHS